MTVTTIGLDDAGAAESWALVRRAQDGDREAFGELYRRYHSMVFRYAYSRIPSRQAAEDVTSETFARALRTLPGVTPQTREYGALLVTIARNLTLDYFKSPRMRREFSVPEFFTVEWSRTPAAHEVIDAEELAVDRVHAEALARVLDAACRRLTPEQRECLELRFGGGLNLAETADRMGRPVSAIKALQYRAIANLARILPTQYGVDRVR